MDRDPSGTPSNTREWLSGVLALLATLAVLPIVFGLESDNTLEVWLDETSAAYRDYELFRSRFGSEEFILVVYPCPDEVDTDFLERLTDFRFELEEIDGVRRVEDLALVYARLFSLRGLEAFRRELDDSPFLENLLVSADGRWAATWLHLGRVRGKERSSVVGAVEETVGRVFAGETVYLAGSPYLNAVLDRSSQRASRTFFPLVFLLSAVVLLALFRRLSGVLIPFVSVGAGIVWTLALVGATGASLNMITVTLPPLVWVLGLSSAIHLLSGWHRYRAEGLVAAEATRLSVKELFRPCLSSSVTTAIGFASLTVSSMRPVREMGVYAAAGVLLCFVSNFLLFPALIGLGAKISDRPLELRRDHPVLEGLLRASRRPRLVLVLTGVFCLVAALAIPRIHAESNPIEFFRDDAPVAVTYERVLPDFTGPYSLEITLEPPSVDLEVLARLDELRAFLEGEDSVARALSIADFVKRAHQEASGDYRLPETEAELDEAWRLLERYPEELEAFVAQNPSAARKTLRLTVLARPMDSGDHEKLVDKVETYLRQEIDPSWQGRVTGIVSLLVDMQQRLVESQIRTFALAFLAIMVVLGLLLRKASYAWISLGPNLVPIVFALGAMGWLGIPLDPATVMISGIALGIAVDDTIHFLVGYRRQRKSGRTPEDAIARTLDAVGRPMVITSLVAALGFLVLCGSDFVPLFHFGLLTAVTMGAALVGDLVILPALLVLGTKPIKTVAVKTVAVKTISDRGPAK